MPLLINCALRSFQSLSVPGMFKIFLYALLLTLAALAAAAGAIAGLFLYFDWFQETGWETIADIAGIIGAALGAIFLFPLTLPVVVSFFDERIADRVEAHLYPDLPISQYPFWPTLWQDVRFSLRALLLNILCLPLYLVPVLNLLIYYVLNGYLLGHQFFRMAAGRHISQADAEPMMVKNRWLIVLGGMIIAFSATIPLLNLLAPFLGVVMMIHLFQHLWQETRQTARP